MRCLLQTLLLLVISASSVVRGNTIDSLLKRLESSKADTGKVFTLCRVSYALFNSDREAAMRYAEQAIYLSQKLKFEKGEAQSLNILGNLFFASGNYIKALETQLKVMRIQEKMENPLGIAASSNTIALIYQEQADYNNALNYFFKSKTIFESLHHDPYLLITLLNIGDIYEKMNKLDSALEFQNKAYELAIHIKDRDNIGTILTNLGNIHYKLGNRDIALSHFRAAVPIVLEENDLETYADALYGIANIFRDNGKSDSAIYYAKRSLSNSLLATFPKGVMNASTLLSKVYEQLHLIDSAYAYYKMATVTRDSLYNGDIIRQVQVMGNNELLRQKEIAENKQREREERQRNLQMLAIAIFIIVFFAILVLISRKKYKPKYFRYLGLLALLLLFEFITIFLHPFITDFTHHIPILVLLVSVSVAALLVPLHHKLEDWVEHKMAHKKKRVYKPRTPATKKLPTQATDNPETSAS
jgi:tetratricopeptide (TPR) repeat protein